jgi:hypothetical protein
MRTVQEEWERYALSCIPPEAPEIQFRECRRAFFAGASALMNRVIEIGNDPISEEEGCRILSAIEAECRQFCVDVAEGRK